MSMQKLVPIAELDQFEPAAALGGSAVALMFTPSVYSSAPQ
jgi:hypothetical protein